MHRVWVALRLAAICLGSLPALLGCSSTSDKLRARFALEEGCPESEVRVTEGGGLVYRAQGCEKTAEYVCGSFAGMGDSARSCQRRGNAQRDPFHEEERGPYPDPAGDRKAPR